MSFITRGIAGSLTGAALVLGLALPAAAIDLDPVSGPSTGGTVSEFLPSGVKFVKALAGSDHMVALGDDGNVYAWGVGTSGQVGDGRGVDVGYPTQVSTPAGVKFTDLTIGDGITLAFGDDGNIYGWGANGDGQIGDGTQGNRQAPVRVLNPDGVRFVELSTGDELSLALGDDGNTYSWGLNDRGQLGYGNASDTDLPAQVATPPGVTFTSISAGARHSLALTAEGVAYSWGSNSYAQLGNGSFSNSNAPAPVTMPDGVSFTAISAGEEFSVALGSDGETYAWGNGLSGQIGTGTTSFFVSVPTRVATPAGVTFTEINAGDAFVLARGDDGNLYSWGRNDGGQLGNGTTNNSATPALVDTPDGVKYTAFSAGGRRSAVAIGDDGHTYAWGFGLRGRLGVGGVTDSTAPVLVTGVTVNAVLYGSDPGTALTSLDDDEWSVTSPSATCGAVDVTTQWTQFGRENTEAMTTAFTYLPAVAPAITSEPESVRAPKGASASLEIEYVGDPQPVLQWESSVDGSNWNPIADQNEAVLEVTVADETTYRVAVTACGSTIYSQAVTVSGESVPVTGPVEEPTDLAGPPSTSASGNLANTGADGDGVVAAVVLGVSAALIGGATLAFARRRTSHQ